MANVTDNRSLTEMLFSIIFYNERVKPQHNMAARIATTAVVLSAWSPREMLQLVSH